MRSLSARATAATVLDRLAEVLDGLWPVEELSTIRLRSTFVERASQPAQLRFLHPIVRGIQPEGFPHDLALVVVETRFDLALDQGLELGSQVDVHGGSLAPLSKIVNP